MKAARVLLPLVLAASAIGQDESAPRPPNIVFLFADDQRADAVAAFGNRHLRTPNLDGLVRDGHRFTAAYCMGSQHGAVCQPSRAMLLSGRTLYRAPHDLQEVTTLPEVLRDHGYATFFTGKWHNGGASCLRVFERGEAILLGGMSDHTAVPVRDIGPDGGFDNERTGEEFSSELFADAAVEFLQEHDGEQPFFLYVAFTAPHDPRQPPEPFRSRAYERLPPLPPNFLPQHPFRIQHLTVRDEVLLPWPRPEDLLRDQIAEYHGMIEHLDEQVGRILAALELTDRSDETIVVYAADHGLALGSHGLLGKQSVYEHSMKAPLLLRGPGIPQGRSDALVYLFDLFPTLCGLAGAPVPEDVEGIDLAPFWNGEDVEPRDSLYLAYGRTGRAVRDDRYKLIRYPEIDHEQLFDLKADPHEMRDLSGEPEHEERLAELRGLLARWHDRIGDPHPLEVDEPKPKAIDLTGHERKPDRHQPDWIVEKYFR